MNICPEIRLKIYVLDILQPLPSQKTVVLGSQLHQSTLHSMTVTLVQISHVKIPPLTYIFRK